MSGPGGNSETSHLVVCAPANLKIKQLPMQ